MENEIKGMKREEHISGKIGEEQVIGNRKGKEKELGNKREGEGRAVMKKSVKGHEGRLGRGKKGKEEKYKGQEE